MRLPAVAGMNIEVVPVEGMAPMVSVSPARPSMIMPLAQGVDVSASAEFILPVLMSITYMSLLTTTSFVPSITVGFVHPNVLLLGISLIHLMLPSLKFRAFTVFVNGCS